MGASELKYFSKKEVKKLVKLAFERHHEIKPCEGFDWEHSFTVEDDNKLFFYNDEKDDTHIAMLDTGVVHS